MKKFISMVMAAAMVASLVPATAFAKGDVSATVKVVDSLNITKDEAQKNPAIVDNNSAGAPDNYNEVAGKWGNKVPELQMTITNTDYRNTQDDDAKLDVTLSLDNAQFLKKDGSKAPSKADLEKLVKIFYATDRGTSTSKEWVPTDDGSETHLHKAGKTDIEISTLADITAGADSVKWLKDIAGGTLTIADTLATDIYVDVNGDGTVDSTDVKIIDASGTAPVFTAACDADKLIDWIAGGTAEFNSAADLAAGTDVTTTFKGQVSIANPLAGLTTNAIGANPLVGTNFGAFGPITDDALVEWYVSEGYETGKYDVANSGGSAPGGIAYEAIDISDDYDEVTFRFTGKFAKDDVIVFDLDSLIDRRSEKRTATVSVESDALSGNADDLVYVSIEGRGITASTKKVANVAEEEKTELAKDLVIKSTVGDFADGQVFELKLSKGFEFANDKVARAAYKIGTPEDNTVYVQYIADGNTNDPDKLTIDAKDLEIEATSAKSGATATITVKAVKAAFNGNGEYDVDAASPLGYFTATTTVEVAKVVDYKVLLSVDEDEDVPVIYSGVNVENYGITDDSDHMSLEVTAEESFPGAWSFRKGFNFELPEGVYVTDVKVAETDGILKSDKTNTAQGSATDVEVSDVEDAFWKSYRDGSHVNFEFEKRVFDDVDAVLNDTEAKMVFQLELVADPTFEGDVVLKLTGDLVDDQEVTIAKFVKPYTVKAEQNDVIIDYRYTDIPTAITITEAEAGLWAKNEAVFRFEMERGSSNFMDFEDDPTFEIDSKSGLEIKNDGKSTNNVHFTVKTESDEAATVTIKDIRLFMNRSIPAGPYDLTIDSSLARGYENEILFAADAVSSKTYQDRDSYGVTKWTKGDWVDRPDAVADVKEDSYIGDVCDYSDVVKEAFINVVTAGRDQDDASFTTKVVVPVGENYIVAGEKQIELDTPAYINAAGYTMLPIRAVAVALGINSNNVLWDQPTKTVTILYGQRIITMTQGQKVVYVNGSAIPASAAVENTNSRTFLPMRDLATALGVTDITWDQATRTATLNGNQK